MSASEVERAREAVRRQMTSPHDDEDDARLAAFEVAVRAEEREACAQVADEYVWRPYPLASEHTDVYRAQNDWAVRIAAAIRARGMA